MMARLAPRRAALLAARLALPADGALEGLHDHRQLRPVAEEKREGASPRVRAELPAE